MPSDPRFSAYSFVDRIDAFESGRQAKGVFAIPASLPAFSQAFVAEAVGQLAAWAAMDKVEFRGRPVAALATETHFHADAKPGATLTLEADLFACDDEAVAYNGRARIDDETVIELVDCLGPMLPVAQFDAPELLRERLALLRGPGAEPGRFQGIDALPVRIDQHVTGEELVATLAVPDDAPFFRDHFPRRPVFPATLLLDTQMRLAVDLAAENGAMRGAKPHPLRMTHVKMRSFIVPSQTVEIGVKLVPVENETLKAMLTAKTGERTVASARLELAPVPDMDRQGARQGSPLGVAG